jgi:putative endonuclease
MKKRQAYFVYILQCKDDTLYTGITTEVKRRLAEHKAGKGSHYTRAHGAAKIIHSEKQANRSEALKREAEIKKWPREKKLKLVSSPPVP